MICLYYIDIDYGMLVILRARARGSGSPSGNAAEHPAEDATETQSKVTTLFESAKRANI